MSFKCPICLNAICSDKENLLSTKCGHVFHYICISEWLNKNDSCPQCRKQCKKAELIQVFLCPNDEGDTDWVSDAIKQLCLNSEESFNALINPIERVESELCQHILTSKKFREQSQTQVTEIKSEILKMKGILHSLQLKHRNIDGIKEIATQRASQSEVNHIDNNNNNNDGSSNDQLMQEIILLRSRLDDTQLLMDIQSEENKAICENYQEEIKVLQSQNKDLENILRSKKPIGNK